MCAIIKWLYAWVRAGQYLEPVDSKPSITSRLSENMLIATDNNDNISINRVCSSCKNRKMLRLLKKNKKIDELICYCIMVWFVVVHLIFSISFYIQELAHNLLFDLILIHISQNKVNLAD